MCVRIQISLPRIPRIMDGYHVGANRRVDTFAGGTNRMKHLMLAALYWLCWWFSRPLIGWLRYRCAPEVLPDGLPLDFSQPVCFVLPQKSWLDVFALQKICREVGLPQPKRIGMALPASGMATYLYLPTTREPGADQEALARLFEQARARPDYNLQLLPVSLFWGRRPASETSIFRILFSDSIGAGRIHKLLIALFNGRNVFAHFAQPVALRDFMRGATTPGRDLRKLGRIFNIHFLRVRTATLGPSLVRRSVLIDGLMRAPAVRHAVEEEVAASQKSALKVRRRARRIAEEIAANYSTTTLSLLDRLLTPVFHRIFRGIDARGLDRVRQLAQTHEVVFTASHRSHLDYLLISYVLYHAGIVPPHIAAGVNLNFWPIGGMLRRGGAFYIRRSFKGDALYTAVFRSYVDMLIARGYSISFYPEGGRSRTGRLLPPKTGLMAMIAESALRQRTRKVAVVPIFVGYDRVPEGATYARELRGAGKQKESAQGLLKATRVLTKSFGKPYIHFGEAIRLQDFADAQSPGWRTGFGTLQQPTRPEDFNALVSALAQTIMRSINASVVAYPVALTAVALLAAPQKAVSETDLRYQIDLLIRLLRGQPGSADIQIAEDDADAVLRWSAPIMRLSRLPHAWGDLLLAEGRQATLLTYYRNNIQHLFAMPSLIASMFRSRIQMPEAQLLDAAVALYPFLHNEFFLSCPQEQSRAALQETVSHMVTLGLLSRAGDALQRPTVASPAFATLRMLSRVMGETLERYCMTAVLLSAQDGGEPIERSRFEEDCRSLAERIAVLSGRMAPEFFDKVLFHGYVDTLIHLGLITCEEDNRLRVGSDVHDLARSALELLDPDVQQTILQLVARHGASANESV